MHYSPDEVTKLRKTRADADRYAQMEAHLKECAECRDTMSVLDEMDVVLLGAEVWEDVPIFQGRAPGIRELLTERAKIEQQNEAAFRRLKPYLKVPGAFEDAQIEKDARFHDPGVVRMLTSQAADRLEKTPKFSLQIANAACAIARKLTEEPPRSQQQLLGCALREQANALRLLGSFREAIAALDEAEPILRALPEGAFDLAIVDYIRGSVVIQFPDRVDEALQLARRAIPIFRQFGDEHRELSARLLEAITVETLEGPAAAAQVYEHVISLSARLNQKEIAAHAYHNAAGQYAELGQLDKAQWYYAEALGRRDVLGNAVGKANTEWQLARLLVLRGELEEGAKCLSVSRRNLLEMGLREEHGLATLDWAGARLALGWPDGVAAACREIVVHYESEGADRNARMALACVHEALRQGTATPKLLRDVRNYLTQLPRNPSVAFQPAS